MLAHVELSYRSSDEPQDELHVSGRVARSATAPKASPRAGSTAGLVLGLALSGLALAQPGPVLSGPLTDAAGATGDVTAYATYLSDANLKVLTYGTLGADGNFTIALPAALDTALLNPVDVAGLCAAGTDALAVEPSGTLHALLMFVMWFGDESGAGAVMASSDEAVDRLMTDEGALLPGDYAVYHLYAAAPFRLSGTCTDESGQSATFNITAPAGWSLVRYGHGDDGDTSVSVTSLSALPAGAQWRSFSD